MFAHGRNLKSMQYVRNHHHHHPCTMHMCMIQYRSVILGTVCNYMQNVFSQFTLFCCKICFVTIYARLCEEKLNQKLCLWGKMKISRMKLIGGVINIFFRIVQILLGHKNFYPNFCTPMGSEQ